MVGGGDDSSKESLEFKSNNFSFATKRAALVEFMSVKASDSADRVELNSVFIPSSTEQFIRTRSPPKGG